MILLRLTQSLRQQNWTSIGIEFILLVSGVFLGIQVSNWNATRLERQLVRGHLSEIAADLRTNLAFSQDVEHSAKQRISAVDYVYHEAFGTRLPTTIVLSTRQWNAPAVEPFPRDKLDELMRSINLVRVSVSARNGYESLISSGRLGLVTNRTLARQIQTYFGNYDELLDTQTNVLRPMRNNGALEQYAIGVSIFDQRPAAEIVVLARENPGFAAYLRSQRELAILNYNLVHNNVGETKTLLAAIEKELVTP